MRFCREEFWTWCSIGATVGTIDVSVAQLDRVTASEAVGRAFESRRAHFFVPYKGLLNWQDRLI